MSSSQKRGLTGQEPESKACKVAGRALYNELSAKGVDLTGVGISMASDGQSPAIYLMLRYKKDLPLAPKTYNGYEVVTAVTGQIVPL